MKYDYIIVGAGLYGCSIASLLSSKNVSILIIDKNDYIGGSCADNYINGILVSKHGPHIFHTSDEEVWNFVQKYSSFKRFTNCVKAKDSSGQMYSLPFNMNTFYEIFGTQTPEDAKRVIRAEIEELNIKNPKNLEEQAISMVGYTIYNKLIKEYTEKQWKCSCSSLGPDIIKRLPLRFTYNNDYYNDTYEALPENGFSKMMENMTNKPNIEIKLNCHYSEDILSLLKPDGKLIYTGSIDSLFDYKFGVLDYRTTYWTYEKIFVESFQGNAVINYTSNKELYTRIIEYKLLNANVPNIPYTIIAKEYPDNFSIEKEPYYPIENDKNIELYKKYKSLADSNKNIFLGGRLALYKYYNMDEIIKQAIADYELLINLNHSHL